MHTHVPVEAWCTWQAKTHSAWGLDCHRFMLPCASPATRVNGCKLPACIPTTHTCQEGTFAKTTEIVANALVAIRTPYAGVGRKTQRTSAIDGSTRTAGHSLVTVETTLGLRYESGHEQWAWPCCGKLPCSKRKHGKAVGNGTVQRQRPSNPAHQSVFLHARWLAHGLVILVVLECRMRVDALALSGVRVMLLRNNHTTKRNSAIQKTKSSPSP